ncbi:MAG: group 1 truncated hemoglobin [Rhodospirillaceae bacterium]
MAIKIFVRALACAALTFLIANAPPARAADDSLFQGLGGREGITRISNLAIDLSLEDPRTASTFADINVSRVKRLLVDQLCALSGGPCKYEGRSMKESHATTGLTNLHFNLLVEDLQIAMDREGVPFHTQNRLLAILASMQRDVVTK